MQTGSGLEEFLRISVMKEEDEAMKELEVQQ